MPVDPTLLKNSAEDISKTTPNEIKFNSPSSSQMKLINKVDEAKGSQFSNIHPKANVEDKSTLSNKTITLEQNPTPSKPEQEAVETEVRKKIVTLDEQTEILRQQWDYLETVKQNTTNPYVREAVQAQIDAIIDAYLVTVCRSFGHIELDEIGWKREAIKTAVYARSDALKDKKMLITVIVTSVVGIGASCFAFFPGGVLGLTGTTTKGIVGVGTSVMTSGQMTSSYFSQETQAKTVIHEYFQTFYNSTVSDTQGAMQKNDQSSRQILDNRRSGDNSRHQAWSDTTR